MWDIETILGVRKQRPQHGGLGGVFIFHAHGLIVHCDRKGLSGFVKYKRAFLVSI